MACNTLSYYLGLNKRFEINTNFSYLQLRDVISQELKIISFYFRKITGSKKGIQ